jgi:negative regulator of sigma E activity
MSNKNNDDEYFFEDDDLDSFAADLDDDKSEDTAESKETVEETADTVETSSDDSFEFDDTDKSNADAADFFSEELGTDDDSTEQVAKSSELYEDDEDESESESFMDKAKEFAGKHRRILIVAGVVVVAFIGVKLIFAPTAQQQLMASAPTPVKQVQQPAPVVVKQVAPSVSKRQFQSVSTAVMGNKNNLNALQSRLGNISAKQADTDDAISQLSSQVQQIQSQNQQLIAQVKLMEKREQDRIKKEVYKKTHYVRYHVQALESGRAWLMGSDGMARTVAVGNVLPHYGKILSIDVDNGTVVTSSGDTLKYGNIKPSSARTR